MEEGAGKAKAADPLGLVSSEPGLRGELLASDAEEAQLVHGSQAVWSAATNTDNQQRARLARRAACLRSRETLAEARIAGGLERRDRKLGLAKILVLENVRCGPNQA